MSQFFRLEVIPTSNITWSIHEEHGEHGKVLIQMLKPGEKIVKVKGMILNILCICLTSCHCLTNLITFLLNVWKKLI